MISFLGVRTDRQTRFWNPHMETCRHTKNFNSKLELAVDLYMLPTYIKLHAENYKLGARLEKEVTPNFPNFSTEFTSFQMLSRVIKHHCFDIEFSKQETDTSILAMNIFKIESLGCKVIKSTLWYMAFSTLMGLLFHWWVSAHKFPQISFWWGHPLWGKGRPAVWGEYHDRAEELLSLER